MTVYVCYLHVEWFTQFVVGTDALEHLVKLSLVMALCYYCPRK